MTAALRLEVAAASHPGLRRPTNQDCFAVDRDLGLLVVADGLGGHPAGEVASKVAVETLQACFADPETTWPDGGLVEPEDGLATMLAAFALANHRVREEAAQEAGFAGMATTLVAALVLPASRSLVLAHAGDSRAYLHRAGRLEPLTADHNVACDMQERARLSPAALAKLPPRTLTRVIGTDESVEPEARVVDLVPGDVLALVTDGLTGVVDDDELAGILDEFHDLDAAVAELIDLANIRGGPDNITVCLGRWAPP